MPASRPVADAVFGLLFDCGFEAAFVVSRDDHRIVAANQRFEELLGRTTSDVVGQPATSVLAFDGEAGDLRDASVLEHPGHYEDVALTQVDGYPIYVTLTVAHVEHPELGALAACLARDTTERGALERELLAKHSALYAAHGELERVVGELRATQRQLEDRNHEISVMAGQVSRFGWRAAVGELCAGIAHNLNNPVAALLSTLRTLGIKLAAGADKAELEALLTRARTSATRIEEHVAAVVSVNRVGSLDAAPRNLDLAHELDTALTLFAGRLGPIELARDYQGPLPAHVPQDPLHHVLANVIDNAVKAMPGGGRLGVAVRKADERWLIEVSDTGGGLPAHVVTRLFEPIVTARPTGAGLGLATAQRLARSWGGDIVHQPVAAGACFAISVPVKELR